MNIISPHKVPTKIEAQKIVHELAEKGNVSLSKHAKERMLERDINMQQILTCLAKGTVKDDPILANGNEKLSGYEITVERFTAGEHLRVVVCLKFSQMALVVTAMKIK